MLVNSGLFVPHPFPYQGSKRNLAKDILLYFPSNVQCLIEPFCGSGAISIAAAVNGFAQKFLLNDINKPLMDLWLEILERPEELIDEYEKLWIEQQSNRKEFFFRIRDEFNCSHQSHHLLYLLARIVKGSIRYNSEGLFNQSADNRRSGMKPQTMKTNIINVSRLFSKKAAISSVDFRSVIRKAKTKDLIYMDPPYQGTSFTRDHRYSNGLPYENFISVLSEMNAKNISYIISYDGTTGKKKHGKKLPGHLLLKHIYIYAGRSSQATLLNRKDETIESLYLSPALVERLKVEKFKLNRVSHEQKRMSSFI